MKTGARAFNQDHSLSDREIEVLEHLARGLSREDIATALQISPETVKAHVKAILHKLHPADRTKAVSRGYRAGWLAGLRRAVMEWWSFVSITSIAPHFRLYPHPARSIAMACISGTHSTSWLKG